MGDREREAGDRLADVVLTQVNTLDMVCGSRPFQKLPIARAIQLLRNDLAAGLSAYRAARAKGGNDGKD